MKRKELMKRALALTLSAVMTIGNTPVVTYASEVEQSGEEVQTEELLQDEQEDTVAEDSQEDELIEIGADVQEEIPVEIDNSTEDEPEASAEVQTADQGFQVMTADDETGDEAKVAAASYLKTNYIDNNKIILNGGTGITKGADGLSYSVGLKTNGTGGAITSINFKKEGSSSSYKSGWYINSEWVDGSRKEPNARGSVYIERPTAEQGAQTFKATLRLFSSDTNADVINDETQASTAALASQEFTITLEAAEPNYTMAVNVQDEEGNPIKDAKVTLEKNFSTVDQKEDGSYDMEKGASYTLTVKKDGYIDYKESYFTFSPKEIHTIKTVTLKKMVTRNVTFSVTDKATGKTVDGAKVTIKKDTFDTVKPESNGSYNLVEGLSYNYTVEAKNYKTATGSFTPDGSTTIVNVVLEKNISEYTVSIQPVETDGTTVISNAKVTVTYEEEDYFGDTEKETLSPNTDGTYTMKKGVEYTCTVKADGYKDAEKKYTPSGTEEEISVSVMLQKESTEFTECKVTVQPTDSEDDKAVIKNATVKVTYEDYDTYYQNPFTAELKANEDGTYTMKKGKEYTCTITADRYENGTAVYTPDGQKDSDTISVSMKKKAVDTKDQQTVDAIKAQFDKEGALRPNYAEDKNILDIVKAKIHGYTDIDTEGVTVSVKSSEDESVISADGTIHYNKADMLNSWGINFSNVSVVYTIEKNGAKAETKASTATICWDRDHYNSKMKAEKDSLTWDKIKGTNEAQTEVTADLTLPQILTGSSRNAWSKITWISSDSDVISIDATGFDAITDPKKGAIHPQPEDKEVTLTATFQANEGSLNDRVEKVSDFASYTVEFKVTVKGTGAVKPTEEQLLAILDQYYTADKIKEFGTDNTADLANCKTDLQLPRYTRIKDEKGEYVFANKEITVTSDSDSLGVNGYRAMVDRFAANDDIKANLIVTFTREGVTAVKKIPVTIKPITEADVQDELKMMEAAKAHYFDGINDGRYADKDSITGDLHPFREMILDENGNPKWIYNNDDITGKGIIPDDMFTDSWEMEGAGYNKFKSSNNAVVAHENLVVNRRENDVQITISSVLSSERYGEYAKKYPNNTVLQKLYKQPVSVTVTIKGTRTAADNLNTKLTELQELYNSITEGSEPGQYPEGTKAKLQTAIAEVKALLGKEDATEEEYSAKLAEVTKLLNEVQDSQKEEEATVTAKFNMEAGQGLEVSQITAKAHTAAQYGYEKLEAYKNKVTILDVLAAWHAAKYGQEFKENPTSYLNINAQGFVTKIYGKENLPLSYMVNNAFPGNSTATEAVVKTGDVITVFLYGDTTDYEDLYLYFDGIPSTVDTKDSIHLTLYGYHPGSWKNPDTPSVRQGYTVAATDAKGNCVATAVTDEKGQAVLNISKAGTYTITVTETPKDSKDTKYVLPKDTVVVTETPDKPVQHVHSFSKWRTVSAATVFAAEKQERVCACGKKETRTVGKALKATIKVNMTTIPLKVKQTTEKLKVSGLAKGDAVASYKSSNKNIFTVDKNGKIKAGNKKGSAKLTITLKSGLKKTLTVKVQKSTVKTTKIQGLNKEITLKKGARIALKPVLQPLTSQQKISYSSSNKKVAAVSSKGSVKAKKTGKTTITVKSGNKKYKIKVTVK